MAEDGGGDVKRKMDELKAKLAEVNAERARRCVSMALMLFASMGQAREKRGYRSRTDLHSTAESFLEALLHRD